MALPIGSNALKAFKSRIKAIPYPNAAVNTVTIKQLNQNFFINREGLGGYD
jgi:hypothetical protein